MRFVALHRWTSAAVTAAVLLAAPPATPQVGPPTRLPFSVGERMDYQVKLGFATVGSGFVEVAGTEEVAGVPTLHARMRVTGGVPLAHVDDRYETWIDPQGVFSRRFLQDVHEVRYHRERTYDFDPVHRTYRRTDGKDEQGTLPTDKPLDELSFMYYARTLPLEVGDTHTLTRYFKDSGNPVVLRVVRRETVDVPAGRFKAIVVQPIIRTSGLFGDGGRAEIYFSDDDRRIPVLIKTRVPVVGSLTMLLRSYRAGS